MGLIFINIYLDILKLKMSSLVYGINIHVHIFRYFEMILKMSSLVYGIDIHVHIF